MNTIMPRGTSHKKLKEAITLLYMLDKCPESPKDNQQSKSFAVLSSIYQLPFQREKQIVESLAFLSATTRLMSWRSALRKVVIVAAAQSD